MFVSGRLSVPTRVWHGLLQEAGCPDINIICERLTVGGLPTRFEDQTRLPMGVSVNSTSYSAKLLQVHAAVRLRFRQNALCKDSESRWPFDSIVSCRPCHKGICMM
jgi:hypothetical protein